MGFFSDIGDAIGGGLSGLFNNSTSGLDDLAHLDFSGLGNDIQGGWDSFAMFPGSPEAALTGLSEGFEGDASWNPYDPYRRSVFDIGAGGTQLSQNPQDRALGRTIGTAVGGYFLAPVAGQALGSATAGNVATGAALGGAQSAGSGGDFWSGALKGGASAGLGSAIGAGNSYLDWIPKQYQPIATGALTGGISAAAQNQNIGKGALMGGLQGAARVQGGGQGVDSYSADFMGPPSEASNFFMGPPAAVQGNTDISGWYTGGGKGDYSPDFMGPPGDLAPNFMGPPQAAMAQGEGGYSNDDFMSRVSRFVRGNQQGQGGFTKTLNTIGTLGTLAGLFRNYQQANKMAGGLRGMFGPNSPYAQQLQQQLARRDAAAGRRSQYGPREVELQAKLAQMANGVAPNILAAQNYGNQSLMQMFNAAALANKQGMFDPMKEWLSGMFSGNQGYGG